MSEQEGNQKVMPRPAPEADPRFHLYWSWIDTCLRDHSECNASAPARFIPTRLVEVDSVHDPESSRLVDTRESGIFSSSPPPYIALSYCWGLSMPATAKTVLATLEARKKVIRTRDLPRMMRDALVVARVLRVPYLWIDSLCIVQDSKEDWERESMQMGQIYSSAYCTIAAGSSNYCDGGFLTSRNSPLAQADPMEGENWESSFLRDNPLLGRGWTLQERELSPRVLHFFSEQVFWECRCLRASETHPQGQRRATAFGRDYRCLDEPGPILALSCAGLDPVEQALAQKFKYWQVMIQQYSTRAFTKPEDKLPALSGLASTLRPILKSDYVAGLWTENLLKDLLWQVNLDREDANLGRRSKPCVYRAPSWSWASTDASICYNDGVTNPYTDETDRALAAQVVEVKVTPEGSDPNGRVTTGFVRIRTVVKELNQSVDVTCMKVCYDSPYLNYGNQEIIAVSILPTRRRRVSALLLCSTEGSRDEYCRVGIAHDIPASWWNGGEKKEITIV